MAGQKKQRRSEASGPGPPEVPLIRTKLYKPRLSSELVDRPRLLQILDRTLEVPLTLVSAPAGYGKSVLVSQWAERQELPCAWLSLDQSDSELRLFLAYVLAAIETVAPDACPSTRELIGAPSLPPIKMIGGQLINELDTIDAPFVLVLDDYHRIGPLSPVHGLLGFILENPPRAWTFWAASDTTAAPPELFHSTTKTCSPSSSTASARDRGRLCRETPLPSTPSQSASISDVRRIASFSEGALILN